MPHPPESPAFFKRYAALLLLTLVILLHSGATFFYRVVQVLPDGDALNPLWYHLIFFCVLLAVTFVVDRRRSRRHARNIMLWPAAMLYALVWLYGYLI